MDRGQPLRRLPLRMICAFAALLILLSGATAARSESTEELDSALRKLFKNYKTSGACLIVARDGEIIYRMEYGFAAKRKKIPVTESTYFRIASVTKMVTGIHVLQLTEQGLLDLDRDISDYLGYTIRNPYSKKTPVTLRMLMSHTSSLNPHGGYTSSRNTLHDLLADDKKHTGNWYDETPGSVYRYSNFGAGIMGSLIEAVTGKNLNDSITDSLFTPLGISAGYSASLLDSPEDVPDLYNAEGSLYASRNNLLEKDWDPGVNPEKHFRITVGSLWIRPTDLCRLGIMLCEGGMLEGRQVLRPETVAAMMAEPNGTGGVTAETPYGLCLQRENTLVDGITFYGHQGMSEGLVSNLYFDPETRFVFVMSTNGSTNSLDHRVVRLSRKAFELAWNAFGK